MIPKNGWREMDDAPTNGQVVMALTRAWNSKNAAVQVEPGQWLCGLDGQHWRWCKPNQPGTHIYPEAWMWFDEFQIAQQKEGFSNSAIKKSANIFQEFIRIPDPPEPEDEFEHFQASPAMEYDL